MRKFVVFIITAILLCSCGTTSKQDATTNVKSKPTYPKYNIPRSVDKIIKGLEGCTKEFAFDVMGLPDGEKIIDEKKYFEWNIRKGTCIIDANVNAAGIREEIYYKDTRNACAHAYVRIVNYYKQNSAQNEQTCPNRTDLQGNHYIK